MQRVNFPWWAALIAIPVAIVVGILFFWVLATIVVVLFGFGLLSRLFGGRKEPVFTYEVVEEPDRDAPRPGATTLIEGSYERGDEADGKRPD